MQKNTAHLKHAARGLTVLGAAGATAAGLLLGALPAHAATLQPALFPDHIEFLGNENNSDVSGPVKLSIHPDGTWNIYSKTRNGRPAFRHVHWTCVVTVQDGSATNSIRVDTHVVKIRRKSSHTFDVSGTSTQFAANYNAIIDPRFTRTDCDIHFGK
ncbi:hypothetical protein [Actinomadura sp. 7K534]|uniref:hypothetical protein n=1 Tax=Actinomadura sp. 7K534 TaxID=2530366 RepID=UPI001053DCC9|nr:hypothetical protein [Actinomadura sp. 7K534]TDB97128.1 hypothetical protein E1266_07530 [Actinomadura sp. 7K534]